MDKVMAQLEGLVAHYEELQEMMADPEVINDTKRYMEISKEEADMREVVQKYRKYKSDIKEIDDNKEIISTESDNDLVEMAKEENSELEKEVAELKTLTTIKILLWKLEELPVGMKHHYLQVIFLECTKNTQKLKVGKYL